MRVCALLILVVCSLAPARADTIYVALDNGDILAVDSQSLTSILVAHTGVRWFDIASGPGGQLYGSDGASLFRIDAASGKSTLIGPFQAFINGLDFIGGTLYGSGYVSLYTIGLGSGRAERVGANQLYSSSGDLEWYRGALYMSAQAGWSDNLVRWDLATGQPVLVGDIGFRNVYGLAATTEGLLGFDANGNIILIDAGTGAGTRVGSTGAVVNGATVLPTTPHPIAEPGAMALLGAGLATMALLRRRRYKR